MGRDKIVIHADVNGHFCYSSLLYFPQLLDVPVVVGGSEEKRHGIVLSKNQQAKRFNIQTGSSLHQARELCPGLLSLPPVYPLYERTSKDFYRFMDRFTDISAPFGCDGKTIDVTGTAHLYGDGPRSIRGVMAIVNELHNRFPREYGLKLSIGVSWNFAMAKLACDTAGSDSVKWIMRESPQDTAWQQDVFKLPVESLLYVGHATKSKLWAKGERTIGDMVRCGPDLLKEWFGRAGVGHYLRATGQEDAPLSGEEGGPPMRSIGNGSTTPYDLTTEEQVHNMVHVLASSVCRRMRMHKVEACTAEVAVSYLAQGDMRHVSYQCPLAVPTNLDMEFAQTVLGLFFKRFDVKHNPIRKLTVRGKDLVFNTSVYQTSLEYGALTREKAIKLAACKDEINERWRQAVVRCVELSDPRMTGLGTKPNQQFAPSGWY